MSKKLIEQRAAVIAEMQELRSKADPNTGAFSAEQKKTWESLNEKFEDIQGSIKIAAEMESRSKEFAEGEAANIGWQKEKGAKEAQHVDGNARSYAEQREISRFQREYRMLRSVRAAIDGKIPDGLEGEMYKEAEKEARSQGLNLEGQIRLPSFMLGAQSRDMTAGTNTAGGHTVQTNVMDIIPILAPRLVVEKMGATRFSGLNGNLSFPRNDADVTATWVAENGDAGQSEPTFDAVTMSPNRLAVMAYLTKNLLNQSSMSIENFVRQRMNYALGIALDKAAIRGAGSSNEPLGLITASGIIQSGNTITMGTNGGAPTWANTVKLETLIAQGNADMGRMGYLTSPAIAGNLKTIEKASNTGQFIWTGNNAGTGEINGYRAMTTTQILSSTKGTGTVAAAIFGNWEELMIAQWGGLDATVDPYTLAGKSMIRLVLNTWWDIKVRHAASFSCVKDWTV